MAQRSIVVEVAADGSTSIDAQGYQGNSCATATRQLEMLLTAGNSDGVEDRKKPDFFARISGTNQQTN